MGDPSRLSAERYKLKDFSENEVTLRLFNVVSIEFEIDLNELIDYL